MGASVLGAIRMNRAFGPIGPYGVVLCSTLMMRKVENSMPYSVYKTINTILEYEDGYTEEYQDNIQGQMCNLECVIVYLNREQKFTGIQRLLDTKILSIAEFQPEGWWCCCICGKEEQFPGGEYYHGTECHCPKCMGD
jgi:hypothetical protein